MARFHPMKNAFVAGELSPRLEARDDLDQYFQGMRQAVNGIVLPHGGFMRRPGTRHVAEVKDSAKRVRLINFEVSVDAAYIVEFGDQYARFYTSEARLESGGSPVGVSTPYDTGAGDDLEDLQVAQSADVMWVVHKDHAPYKLSRTSATSFTFTKIAWREGRAPMRAQNTDSTNTLTVTGTGPYTLTWNSDPDGGLATADDVGRYVRHNDGTNEAWYEITAVTNSKTATADLKGGTASTAAATDDWSLGAFSDSEGPRAVGFHQGRLGYYGTAFEPDRFWLSESDDFDRFELQGASTDAAKAISKRATRGTVSAGQWMVAADEVLWLGSAGGLFSVTAADDVLTPDDSTVKPAPARQCAHAMPVVVDNDVFYIQRTERKLRRLLFDLEKDGRIAQQLSILAEHVLRPVEATSGRTQLAFQSDPESVVWAKRPDGVLVGFTVEREQRVVGAHRHKLGGSFGAVGWGVIESIAVIPAPDGSHEQLWLAVKRTINGVTKRYIEFMEDYFEPSVDHTSTVDALTFAVETAFFVDSGLSLDNPVGGGITDVTQASPGVVTTASAHGLSDGDRITMRDVKGMTEVNGVSYLVSNKTSTTFELHDLDGNDVDTSGFGAYVGGGTVREEVTTVSGLDHLEAEEVQVLADGAVQPTKTVSSGSITLDDSASIVHVGLASTFTGETQRFIGGGRLGTDQGQVARIAKVVLRLLHTVGIEVGSGASPAKFEVPVLREGNDPLDAGPPLFSGDKEIGVPQGWSRTPTIHFRVTDPLPATVLGVMPRMRSGEG